MKLAAISNHIQIYSERNEKFLLVNKGQDDIAFKRVMLDRKELETLKNLIISLGLEAETDEKESSK